MNTTKHNIQVRSMNEHNKTKYVIIKKVDEK